MPLYDTVCDPESKVIDAVAWTEHARTSRPVGLCRQCGGALRGSAAVRDFRLVYRDVICANGHEATIPGGTYKGRVIAAPGALFGLRSLEEADDE